MAYTDKEKLAFSEIAYIDLDRGVNKYLLDHPGETSAPLSELLNPDNHYLDYLETDKMKASEVIQEYRNKLEVNGLKIDSDMASWKITAVHDTNSDNGFYACVIETSDKEATVAFRGTEGLDNLDNLKNDGIEADLKLLNNTHTSQELEADRYLKELEKKGFFDQYDGVSFAGHSLGGALADYGCIATVKLGYADKIEGCYNMDGPGHSLKYIKENREYIDQVEDKMEHKIWSWVGLQEHNLIDADKEQYLGVLMEYDSHPSEIDLLNDHNRYIEKDGKDKKENEYSPNFIFDENGNIKQITKEELLEKHPIADGSFGRLTDVTMYYGEKVYNIGKKVVTYSSPLYWGYKLASTIWNKVTGGGKHKETPEEAALRIANAECSQNIGFYIDPAAVSALSVTVQSDVETRAKNVKYALEDIQRTHYTKSTGKVIYNNAGLAELKHDIDQAEAHIKRIQDCVGTCKSMIGRIQETLIGMASYLYQTGSAFQKIEDEASSKASSWIG